MTRTKNESLRKQKMIGGGMRTITNQSTNQPTNQKLQIWRGERNQPPSTQRLLSEQQPTERY